MAAAHTPRRAPLHHRAGLMLALAGMILFAFFPVYWMLVTSLRTTADAFTFPPSFVPTAVTFEHYRSFFANPALVGYAWNSIVVSVATAVGSVLVATYAAYSFSKFRYRGRTSLMYLVLSAQMFPQALLLITLYLMFDRFGLLNTYPALILSFTTITLPLSVFLLKGYFDKIPDDVIEAARVDGARQRDIIHRILLPIAKPGLVATGLFAFIRGWNDFIYALTLVGPDRRTLPPGLVLTYIGEFQAAWPELMAASLVVSLPVVVGFIGLQRYLIEGLTAGAVKG